MISAAMKTITTSASSSKHQVISAVMKSTRSLHVISAGAGDHQQLSAGSRLALATTITSASSMSAA
jgi:hypothetical protein